MVDDIGLVGSPSTTGKVTIDIMEEATEFPLRGQLVSLVHPLENRYLIALGTVTEIKTSNRWHEDANMRGVLKRHGSLPHLSAVGDVRTADVSVQAVYLSDTEDPSQGEPAEESGGALSMSPTTGARVHRINDPFLSNLLRQHADKIVKLGFAYGMDEVRLPVTLRHFGPTSEGGAGEAYHLGIFGMTGSGKSVFATYLLAAYARHPQLGILIIDPQGQFATGSGIPFSLREWSGKIGRPVKIISVSQNLRLRQNAPLLIELLGKSRFFRDLLTIRGSGNQESAAAEFVRLLQGTSGWPDLDAATLLRGLLTRLDSDLAVINRIYVQREGRDRMRVQVKSMLENDIDFATALEIFQPLHSLFAGENLQGGVRRSMEGVLHGLLNPDVDSRPLVVIDVSNRLGATDSDSAGAILETTPIKARLIREICSTINRVAEERYGDGQNLNTMVVFDEAQRFASANPEDDESESLADRLVEYVRSTRKYGVGWAFITQEISSLRRGIYSQLRVRCFGYGLTSGTERERLRETVGDTDALELYRSFVDPQAIQPSQYPFMLTGPVSPLSFTGAPIFLSVYTDFDEFKRDNGFGQ